MEESPVTDLTEDEEEYAERELARQQSECREDALGVLRPLVWITVEHENLLSREQLKTLDAAAEVLRTIAQKMEIPS
jgi:hypothetical protein